MRGGGGDDCGDSGKGVDVVKYTVEVTKDCIIKTFDSGEKVYTETWIKEGSGSWKTTGLGITTQIDRGNREFDDDLYEALESDDFIELMECFREGSVPAE